MSLNHSPKIVTDGLVLCLDAASRKSYPGSGTTWFDRSGNGNNGTLVNGVGYNSGNGGNLVFDGVDDFVNLGTSLTNNFINITVSCWVYVINNTGRQDIVTKYPFINGWLLYYSNNTNKFGVDGRENTSLYISCVSENIFNVNKWYNIVFTKQGSNWKLYVNNQLENNTIAGSGSIPFDNNGIFAIGALPVNGDYGNHQIAQVSIYNRALSINEIKQNFNATRGRYGI